MESDIRVGSYSYDVKKEKWCEVSLKVSIAEVHLTRPPEQMSIWTYTRVNSIVSLFTMALSFIFLESQYSCSAQTNIHADFKVHLNPSPKDFQLKKPKQRR